MLLIVLLMGGAKAVAADTETLYGRALTADADNGYIAWSADDIAATGSYKWGGNAEITTKGYPYVSGNGTRTSSMSAEISANSIITIDAVWFIGTDGNYGNNYTYFKIGDAIEFQAHTTNQTGNVVINGSTATIANACGKDNGNRTNDSWTIHAVINTASNTLKELTVNGEIGTKKATYILSSETSLGTATYNTFAFGTHREKYQPNCGLVSLKISEEKQSVSTYDYTLNYKFGDEIINTVSGKNIDGGTVSAENPITIDGTKYFAEDGATTEFTVSATSDNTFNVALRKANTYKVILNAVNADKTVIKELASKDVTEGDATEITLYAPKYITDANNKVTYKIANESYGIKCPVSNEAQAVEYSKYTGVAWFVEGEAVLESADMEHSNYSGGHARRGLNGIKDFITVPEAGKYNMTYAVCNNNVNYDCTVTFYKNSESEENVVATKDDIKSISVNKVKTDGTVKVENIEFANGDVIKVKPSTTNCILDYILIEKTADVLSLSTDYTYSTYTPSSDVNLTNEDGVEFYAATVNGNKVVLTQVEGAVKAGTGLLVKNTKDATSVTLATAADAQEVANNNLVGVAEDMDAAALVADNAYILVDDNTFQKVGTEATGVLAKGKAYLRVSATEAQARQIYISNPTAVNAVAEKAEQTESVIYNMQGMRVKNADANGLYIVNGKKYIKK